MGKPPARRVGGKASNKNGSFSLDLPYPIGPFPKNPSFEDSAGVDIDFADLLDRIKNGNQFKKGKKVEGKYFVLSYLCLILVLKLKLLNLIKMSKF